MNKISESLGLSYPEEYLPRIQALKRLGEDEIAKVINNLLTEPQWIVNRSSKMTLGEAIKDAIHDGMNMVEVAAPLLAFPRATPEKWNGDIDHIDTITGEYFLFTGKKTYITYGDHLLTKFKGGPQIVPSLRKALGNNFNITMVNDANKSPASRFVIVFPPSLQA